MDNSQLNELPAGLYTYACVLHENLADALGFDDLERLSVPVSILDGDKEIKAALFGISAFIDKNQNDDLGVVYWDGAKEHVCLKNFIVFCRYRDADEKPLIDLQITATSHREARIIALKQRSELRVVTTRYVDSHSVITR